MRENAPASNGEASESAIIPKEDSYTIHGNTRNVCFVSLDGNRMFLNYSYLVSGEYVPEDNIIVLGFTSHTLTLKGIHLEPLFYEFMQHLPRQILCVDDRYNVVSEKDSPIVNEIGVKKNNE